MKLTLGGVRGSSPVAQPEFMHFGGETTAFLIEGAQGERILIDGGTGVRLLGKTLMESLHHSDGRELKITTRGGRFKYRWQAEYGAGYTFIPLQNISRVTWQEDVRNTAVSYLNLQTAGEAILFAFTRDNLWIPEYDRFLESIN